MQNKSAEWKRSAECWVERKCWVLSAECWVLSAECWVKKEVGSQQWAVGKKESAGCWVLSEDEAVGSWQEKKCWVLSAERRWSGWGLGVGCDFVGDHQLDFAWVSLWHHSGCRWIANYLSFLTIGEVSKERNCVIAMTLSSDNRSSWGTPLPISAALMLSRLESTISCSTAA